MAGLVVEKTQKILFEKIPKLREQYWEASAKPKPKWMDRLQAAAGPHKTGDDPHIAGRALDIVLFSGQPLEKNIADHIVEVFLGLREKMHWIAVIYNKEQWHRNGTKTPRLRKDDPAYEHITHIHIEWEAAGLSHTGFEADLEKNLLKVGVIGESFYFYSGGGDEQKIREMRESYSKKIKDQGGTVTEVMSVWVGHVVQLGDEVKQPGDPLPTDLETARLLGVKIIEPKELDVML